MMTTEEIRQRMQTFGHWLYQWDFGHGLVTQPADAAQIVSQRLRVAHVFDSICATYGGGSPPFQGLRVLDIGCNEGAFAVEARRRGAQYVLGVEPRAEKVDQATFVARALGLERIEYRCASIWDLTLETCGTFDIVLCVGVLYHLDRPYEALQRLRTLTKGMLVVDTQLLCCNYPLVAIKEEDRGVATNAFASELVQVPSAPALRLMLAHAGFADVRAVPRPRGRMWKQCLVGRRYLNGTHGTFIALSQQVATAKERPGIQRTGLEEVHSGLFCALWQPATFGALLRATIGLWARTLPGRVYHWKPVGRCADALGITKVAKRLYHQVFQ